MRRLVAIAVCGATAAWAGVSGHVSAQGQAVALHASDVRGGAQESASLMLQEAIGLHYSGLPFGRNAAVVSAGLEALNADSWGGGGVAMSGRAATLDLSVGLFPRRALPLRLYARGTVTDASGPSVITLGGRESLLYGLSLNLSPGKTLPGLRLDAQEQRFTAPGSTQLLGDLSRSLAASVYKAFGASQLNVGAQVRQDERSAVGAFTTALVSGAFTAPTSQTDLVYTQADRKPADSQVVPGGEATDRQLQLGIAQRWAPTLLTSARVRVTDSRFAQGSGTRGGLGLGTTWKPLAAHELLLSADADLGLTSVRGAQGDASGYVAGGGARVGYGRPVGRFVAGGAVAANATHCECVGTAPGTRSVVEGALTLATLDFQRFDGRADYRLAVVQAPLALGGDRLEHHAQLQTQARLRPVAVLFTLAYDDSVREFVDVSSGTTLPFNERVFVGAVGGSMPVQKGTLSAEVRHALGASFAPQSPFLSAPLPASRGVTNLRFDGHYPISSALDARGGASAIWTNLGPGQLLFTGGLLASLTAKFGRLSGTLSYQYTRTDTFGVASNQHLLRVFFTRPFSL